MSIKVLIVDDHPLIRAGIKNALSTSSNIEIIAEANSGEEAIQFVKKYQPDVILMDLQMSGIGGFEATRILLQRNPHIKIVILTVCKSDLFPIQLLDAGALGYITKDSDPSDIVAAVKAASQGKKYLSNDIAQNIALHRLDLDKNKSPFNRLSKREFEIMLFTVNGKQNKDIAKELNLSPKTISTYYSRIFSKLNIKTHVELLLLAIQHDIVEQN